MSYILPVIGKLTLAKIIGLLIVTYLTIVPAVIPHESLVTANAPLISSPNYPIQSQGTTIVIESVTTFSQVQTTQVPSPPSVTTYEQSSTFTVVSVTQTSQAITYSSQTSIVGTLKYSGSCACYEVWSLGGDPGWIATLDFHGDSVLINNAAQLISSNNIYVLVTGYWENVPGTMTWYVQSIGPVPL